MTTIWIGIAPWLLVSFVACHAEPVRTDPGKAVTPAEVTARAPSAATERRAACNNAIHSDDVSTGAIVHLDTERSLRVEFGGKLDSDDHIDFIASIEGTCSSYGDCERMAFLGCGDGDFTPVYGPEYAMRLQAGTRDAHGNLILIKIERSGNAAEFELRTRDVRLGTTGYVEDSTTTLLEKSHEPS